MRTHVVAPGLDRYVPRLAAEWGLDSPNSRWQELDATCCFVDISGFTALSERLARRGRIGTEELTTVLDNVFSKMLGVAYEKGGALLKFGGDALLLMFTGDDHAVRAAQAAVAMRATLRLARTMSTSVGRVNLRMSVGVNSGRFHLFLVGASHSELLVTGPAATRTTRMEQIAQPGEIVISDSTAAILPASAVGPAKGDGFLLRWRVVPEGGPGPIAARRVPREMIEKVIPLALRAPLALRGGESEHRLASVAFVKFQGIDHLLASDGPEATATALERVISAVQEAVDAESVTFLATDIDTDGGKIILATGVPATLDDDEGRLLRATRAIVERPLPLPLRIGVNGGHVFAGDVGTDFRRTFTVMGDTVNLAARLMTSAAPGELLTTAGVLDRSRTSFASEPMKPFAVKGKSQSVQAFRVGSSIGPKLHPGAGDTLPFRGRDAELAILANLFRSARHGRGAVAVVEAERGTGKTRLVSELVSSEEPARVLHLQGEAHGTGFSYLPLRAALRAVLGVDAADRRVAGRQVVASFEAALPDLLPLAPLLAPVVDAEIPPTPGSEAIAEEFVRDRIADLVIAAIDAAEFASLLIVAEDAHWFDDSTTHICMRLAKEIGPRPWVLCATRRPEQRGFQPSDPDLRMVLEPLAEDSARALVEEVTDSAPLRPHERDRIVGRAGGNPLFLEELLRIVRVVDVDVLPESLDAVAMREIDALAPIPRRVLRLASVLGRAFDLRLLAEILVGEGVDVGDDPLDGLRAQLIHDGGDMVRFRHAVLQEAAYQSLPFRSRLALHRDAGQAIERSADDLGRAASSLSFHYLAAQDWAKTWTYARRAACVARTAHAPTEAAKHLEDAVTAARRLGRVHDDELTTVFVDLGWTLELIGEYVRADDAYRRGAQGPEPEPAVRAHIADRRAYIRSEYLGLPSAAIRQLHVAEKHFEALGLDDVAIDRARAHLLAREAEVRMRQGRLSRALACSQRAAELAERTGERRALAVALYVLDACLLQMGRIDEATHMGRVLELYEELEDQQQVAVALGNLGGVAFFASRWEEAATYFVRAAEASIKSGDLAWAAISRGNLAEIRVNQGRLDEAAEVLFAARRTLESYGYRDPVAIVTMHLGRTLAFRGDVESGADLVRSAADTFDENHSSIGSLEARARLAEVLVFGGRLLEAETCLAEARHLERAAPDSALGPLLDRVELTLAVVSGAPTACEGLDQCLARARELGATYDLLVDLSLSEQLGNFDCTDEAARLREVLGVVRLPMLPDPEAR